MGSKLRLPFSRTQSRNSEVLRLLDGAKERAKCTASQAGTPKTTIVAFRMHKRSLSSPRTTLIDTIGRWIVLSKNHSCPHHRRASLAPAEAPQRIQLIYERPIALFHIGGNSDSPVRLRGGHAVALDPQPHCLLFEIPTGLLSLRRDIFVDRVPDAEDLVGQRLVLHHQSAARHLDEELRAALYLLGFNFLGGDFLSGEIAEMKGNMTIKLVHPPGEELKFVVELPGDKQMTFSVDRSQIVTLAEGWQ
jgi:hypothetical protein